MAFSLAVTNSKPLLKEWNNLRHRWVERDMEERFSCVERLEHLAQMLLGAFSAKGVLLLDFKPAHSVGDLLTQHVDELEQEAERKGGVLQTLADHFGKVYKATMSLAA